LSSFKLNLALLYLILEFLLLLFALHELLLKELDFGVDFLELRFFLTEIGHLLLDCLPEDGEFSAEGFCLGVDDVVLVHALDPHLKVLGSERRFSHLIVVEFWFCYNSRFQFFHGSIGDVVFVVHFDHLYETHQILHQELTTHFKIVFLFLTSHSGLGLFIDDFSSIGHDPVPEEDDQTSADSHDGGRGVVETFDFIQMFFFEFFNLE
jgi:hypothetical protein